MRQLVSGSNQRGAALLLLSCALLGGCDLPSSAGKLSDLDAPHLDADDVGAEIERILKALFPDLTAEERTKLTASLSLEDVVALQDELVTARKAAAKFADELITTASESVQERETALSSRNDAFPEGLGIVSTLCRYDAKSHRGEVQLSGVFDGKEDVRLSAGDVQLSIDGVEQNADLTCLHQETSVDVVFLIDITGSMSNVIHAVRDSVVSFVDQLEASGLEGTLSVVTFQDSVGVNTSFQEPAPAHDYERSPFFTPVSLAAASQVDALRAFVNRLEANRGADAPENLSAAIDFARNNVIGYTRSGAPNVIGDGKEDPAGTEPFPALKSARQVFVAFTDITFHGDDRNETNSSLLAPFVPRDAADILRSLQRTGTTVHVSDPSWSDASLNPEKSSVDADYWAIHTGGVGEDVVAGYSLVDLELVVVAKETGLLDITLDRILASSCSLSFEATLDANAEVRLSLQSGEKTYATGVEVEHF